MVNRRRQFVARAIALVCVFTVAYAAAEAAARKKQSANQQKAMIEQQRARLAQAQAEARKAKQQAEAVREQYAKVEQAASEKVVAARIAVDEGESKLKELTAERMEIEKRIVQEADESSEFALVSRRMEEQAAAASTVRKRLKEQGDSVVDDPDLRQAAKELAATRTLHNQLREKLFESSADWQANSKSIEELKQSLKPAEAALKDSSAAQLRATSRRRQAEKTIKRADEILQSAGR